MSTKAEVIIQWKEDGINRAISSTVPFDGYPSVIFKDILLLIREGKEGNINLIPDTLVDWGYEVSPGCDWRGDCDYIYTVDFTEETVTVERGERVVSFSFDNFLGEDINQLIRRVEEE